ncbi:uncharacterized protein B0I36DRAFT_356600 [Microdochium trichocladiopsis]|uniref:Uncharacterized protein n=1 Tax=Microdochium trichocladiopsis TaxID=1682393 RepID=A0A9P8XQ31_9PEZI|nr:uncharacterized protein B0I36DRAFT_356600 [Microdochium trichocladiopsis]KAH7010701.1 hypothetical protein B0I36DRAFT_356600 [Microdochium trichocladiopsis]
MLVDHTARSILALVGMAVLLAIFIRIPGASGYFAWFTHRCLRSTTNKAGLEAVPHLSPHPSYRISSREHRAGRSVAITIGTAHAWYHEATVNTRSAPIIPAYTLGLPIHNLDHGIGSTSPAMGQRGVQHELPKPETSTLNGLNFSPRPADSAADGCLQRQIPV